MSASLPEKDVADEGTENLIDAPEIAADDDDGDDDGDRALDHLGAIRPVNLVKLGPRLAEKAAASPRLTLDWRDRPTTGTCRLGHADGLARRLLA